MTAQRTTPEPTTPRSTAAGPALQKTGIPKNPGRTCYSEQGPDEIFRRAVDGDFDPLKMQKLIGSVIESGHGSTIEHVVFTFAISGVSRTLSHQLVRHRAGVAFDQQSPALRQVQGCGDDDPHSIVEGDPALRERYEAHVDGALGLYGELLQAGVPGEDRASSSRMRRGRTSS